MDMLDDILRVAMQHDYTPERIELDARSLSILLSELRAMECCGITEISGGLADVLVYRSIPIRTMRYNQGEMSIKLVCKEGVLNAKVQEETI